jgi:hypothetical protein
MSVKGSSRDQIVGGVIIFGLVLKWFLFLLFLGFFSLFHNLIRVMLSTRVTFSKDLTVF